MDPSTERTTPRVGLSPALLDLAIVRLPLLDAPGPRYSSSRRPQAYVPNRTSAAARSGYVAAKNIASGPVESIPNRAGRSEPAASMTVNASATRVSSVGSRPTVSGSERPDPRGSKHRTRASDARASRNGANDGSVQISSMFEYAAETISTSIGPSPAT